MTMLYVKKAMFEHRSLLCLNIGKKVVKPRFYWSGTMLIIK